jgi:hypothetical protein
MRVNERGTIVRRLSFCAVLFFLLAAPGFAADQPVLTDAEVQMLLGESNQCSGKDAPATTSAEQSYCFARADCGDGVTVSCSGNSSCQAWDSNCAVDYRGRVKCDGSYTYCPLCPMCVLEYRKCTTDSYCRSGGTECSLCFCDYDPYAPHGFCICP